MRKIFLFGVLLCGAAVAFSSQSCKGEPEPINGVCSTFCDALVDAMDDSDYYDLSFEGVGGTKKNCGKDCTEVVDEYNQLDRGDMGDCVECIGDKGFNQIGDTDDGFPEKDDWTMDSIPMDIIGDPLDPDCMEKCDREDIKYYSDDGGLISEFLMDFFTDFVHHWSDAEPFCDGYNGDDLCCKESNPCFIISHNGDCECGDNCGWDIGDCSGSTDVDTDTDTDTDTETDTDYCAAGCPWDWVGDGICDDVCNVADCLYDDGDCA